MDIQAPKKLELLWTPKQVAKYFAVQDETVWTWIRTKKVFDPEKIIKVGRAIRIPRSEVERVAGIKREEIISNSMT